MELKIRLLQVPRIWLDGKEVSFPLRRADALLFYLVCNKTATREEIVSLLWDQCDVETGRRNLRNLLYVIKKHLGIDLVVSTQKNKLSLNQTIKIDCDYLKFMEQGDYMAMHGPFLNGFGIKDSCAFDEWVDQTRTRAHKQYLACLTAQVRSTIQTGTVGRAERCALEYLQENPADEQMARFLISLYQSQSRFFDGIQIYQRLHEYLSQEMGITPLAETTQLYQKVLREWNLAVCEQNDTLTEQYLPPSRQRLMRRMNGLLFPPTLRSRQVGGSVFLRGSIGVGKTFLAEQYLKNLNEDILVLQSTCFRSNRREKLSIWQPIITILRQIICSEPQSYSKQVAFTAEQLAVVSLQESALETVEPLISQVLVSCLEKRRILICLENVQWADSDSLFLLSRLLRKFCNEPISCLLIGRDALPTDIEEITNDLVEDGLLSICPIHNFSLGEVREFLQSNLNSRVAEDAGPIYEATEGNPCLLKRLIQPCCQEAVDAGILLHQIDQLAVYRLEMLPADVRQLINLAAFFPEGTQEEVLFRLLDAPRDEFTLALREALDAQILQATGPDQGGILTFKDGLLRQQIYQTISDMERRDTHERIARMLEMRLASTYEFRQAEYHYQQAGDWNAVFQIRDIRCECFLKSFPGKASEQFYSELYQTVAEIGRDTADLTSVPECVQKGNTRWLDLLMALSALFSGRDQDALQKLELILDQEDERRPSLFHVSLCLISQWAWQKGCAKKLAESMDVRRSAMISLLRGELLSIAGSWSLSETVLRELVNNEDPLACSYACYLIGRNHQRQSKAEAGQWYQRTISNVANMPVFWGISQLYGDAGRWAWAQHEEMSARSLFESALYLAAETKDLRTLATAQAYLSALMVPNGSEAVAVQFLREAQMAAEGLSAFEQGAVCLAKARILCTCERYGKPMNIWSDMITNNAAFYARRGLMLLYPLKDVDSERFILRECLRFAQDKQE